MLVADRSSRLSRYCPRVASTKRRREYDDSLALHPRTLMRAHLIDVVELVERPNRGAPSATGLPILPQSLGSPCQVVSSGSMLGLDGVDSIDLAGVKPENLRLYLRRQLRIPVLFA